MFVVRELRYQGAHAYNHSDWEAVIENLRTGEKCSGHEILRLTVTGSLNPGSMITSKIKMEDLVEEGFMPLIKEKDKHVKILVDLKA